MRFFIACLVAVLYGYYSFAAGPNLIFKNQFGEQTNATTLSTTSFIGGTVGASTIISNLGTLGAAPIGNTYAAVSAKLVPTMLLTGFTTGTPGVVLTTDTVIQGMQKINANMQGTLAISNVLTGYGTVAAGGTLSSADTVLGAFKKLSSNVTVHMAPFSSGSLGCALVSDVNTLLTNLQAAGLMK